jgi:hypothetical protein
LDASEVGSAVIETEFDAETELDVTVVVELLLAAAVAELGGPPPWVPGGPAENAMTQAIRFPIGPNTGMIGFG